MESFWQNTGQVKNINSLNIINNKVKLGHSLQLNRNVFSDVYNLKNELC